VTPAKIDGASIPELLDNLKLPEFRARYRTRRELRGRNADEVASAIKTWAGSLDKNDSKYEHYLTEALWVTWGLNKVDQELLRQLLQAKDYRARAAAVRVLRYMGHQVKDQDKLLMEAVKDEHGRVRLEAIVAASWLPREKGLPVLAEAEKKPLDEWMVHAHEAAVAHINGISVREKKEEDIRSNLTGSDLELYNMGKEIYSRDGYCSTCHQPDGRGLSASLFPPIVGTPWVLGSEERLIKLVLKGLLGPIEVLGREYPGQVPMTPYEGMLNDNEIAAVLTYVRNSFGNQAPAIRPDKVKEVRASVADRKGFYSPADLLKEHPMEK
jgi:mono/diheme cytochrome c family protein